LKGHLVDSAGNVESGGNLSRLPVSDNPGESTFNSGGDLLKPGEESVDVAQEVGGQPESAGKLDGFKTRRAMGEGGGGGEGGGEGGGGG
jgi:hypothetical protein